MFSPVNVRLERHLPFPLFSGKTQRPEGGAPRTRSRHTDADEASCQASRLVFLPRRKCGFLFFGNLFIYLFFIMGDIG